MSQGYYIKELVEEKESLNPTRYSHAIRLLEEEIYRMRITSNEERYRDYSASLQSEHYKQPQKKSRYQEEVVQLSEKVIVPVNKYPNYNFVGKVLGPKGSILKAIQATTKTKILILGKGSSRDPEKEEEWSESDDPRYDHLKEPLHVLIRVEAPKSEAHAQIAAALTEIKKYMIPDNSKMMQGLTPFQEEIVKINEKVILPVKEYPKYNFVGKLLGPKGNTLKSIQSNSQTRISILGRGSTREKGKEEDLIKSNEPKYKHLKEPLHVLIQVEAPRSEAHKRLAAALRDIKKYMDPDNEEVSFVNNLCKDNNIHFNYRAQNLQGPIIRIGIPPPGSIILSRPLSVGSAHDERIHNRTAFNRYSSQY